MRRAWSQPSTWSPAAPQKNHKTHDPTLLHAPMSASQSWAVGRNPGIRFLQPDIHFWLPIGSQQAARNGATRHKMASLVLPTVPDLPTATAGNPRHPPSSLCQHVARRSCSQAAVRTLSGSSLRNREQPRNGLRNSQSPSRPSNAKPSTSSSRPFTFFSPTMPTRPRPTSSAFYGNGRGKPVICLVFHQLFC